LKKSLYLLLALFFLSILLCGCGEDTNTIPTPTPQVNAKIEGTVSQMWSLAHLSLLSLLPLKKRGKRPPQILEGKFSIVLPGGTYTVILSKDGYWRIESPVS